MSTDVFAQQIDSLVNSPETNHGTHLMMKDVLIEYVAQLDADLYWSRERTDDTLPPERKAELDRQIANLTTLRDYLYDTVAEFIDAGRVKNICDAIRAAILPAAQEIDDELRNGRNHNCMGVIMEKEIYPDILSRAIPNDNSREVSGMVLTDHGWISDEDFALLVNRRLPAYLKKQVYVKTLESGETWIYYPDGTKSLRNDSNGNLIKDSRRIPQ